MINFSLNTCWRLIPTAKSKGGRTVDHLCFFYSHPKDLLQALPDRQTD